MKKQFDDLGGRYGAPMGRSDYGTPENTTGKIRLFHVVLDSGGYDDSGAYWGHGRSLYCATDEWEAMAEKNRVFCLRAVGKTPC